MYNDTESEEDYGQVYSEVDSRQENEGISTRLTQIERESSEANRTNEERIQFYQTVKDSFSEAIVS